MVAWPDMKLPPINLWTVPYQWGIGKPVRITPKRVKQQYRVADQQAIRQLIQHR